MVVPVPCSNARISVAPEATRAAQVLRAQEGYGQMLRTETIGGYVASVVGTHPSSRLLEALHVRQAA